MTSKEFLQSNKQLLIGAVGTKINLLEQKVRWERKPAQTSANQRKPNEKRINGRLKKIKELAIILEWLDNGTFED